jgi:hypothetical protein
MTDLITCADIVEVIKNNYHCYDVLWSPLIVQKPEALTIFGRSDCNINLDINDLTPTIDGQFIPAESGQDRWLFHTPGTLGTSNFRHFLPWVESALLIFSGS